MSAESKTKIAVLFPGIGYTNDRSLLYFSGKLAASADEIHVRKATQADIDSVTRIYDNIHTAEEKGTATIGWKRGVYPVRTTALAALDRDDLFVMEDHGTIVGTAIINQVQVDAYADGKWEHEATPDQVMVLHTLIIDPEAKGRGYGTQFVRFYEDYALQNGCPYLRMDTNAKNAAARRLYNRLGYKEIGIVPCVFNGLEGVQLVLIEKYLLRAECREK